MSSLTGCVRSEGLWWQSVYLIPIFPWRMNPPLLSPHCFFYLLEGALNDVCQLFFSYGDGQGLTTGVEMGQKAVTSLAGQEASQEVGKGGREGGRYTPATSGRRLSP